MFILSGWSSGEPGMHTGHWIPIAASEDRMAITLAKADRERQGESIRAEYGSSGVMREAVREAIFEKYRIEEVLTV